MIDIDITEFDILTADVEGYFNYLNMEHDTFEAETGRLLHKLEKEKTTAQYDRRESDRRAEKEYVDAMIDAIESFNDDSLTATANAEIARAQRMRRFTERTTLFVEHGDSNLGTRFPL